MSGLYLGDLHPLAYHGVPDSVPIVGLESSVVGGRGFRNAAVEGSSLPGSDGQIPLDA